MFGLFEISLIQPSPIQIETLSLSQKNLSQCQDYQSQDVLRDLQGLNQVHQPREFKHRKRTILKIFLTVSCYLNILQYVKNESMQNK